MANSYLYPRKQKKFKKTKITLFLILLICILLASFYFYKTKVKNETMVLQSPIVFIQKTERTSTSQPRNQDQTSTFKKIKFAVTNKQLIENQVNGTSNVLVTYDVSITNSSKESIKFAETDFTLVQNGTRYTGMIDNSSKQETFKSEAIKPSKNLTRTIIFSVSPEIAKSADFNLMISNDSWNNQQTTIPLNN